MCDIYNKLCTELNCVICLGKSFMSHEKHIYIKDKITNNPRFISLSSGKKIEFNCDKCTHSFTSIVANITGHGRWCAYCANQKLCDNNDCMECHNKSFASSPKIKHLVDKEINPRQIFLKSETKVKFQCDNCIHTFISMVRNVSVLNSWCPYCCFPPLKLCDNNNCIDCYNKSFASHNKSIHMSKNNNILARNIFLNSHQKITFVCNDCKNDFEAVVKNVTRNNLWCSCTIFKTEKILFDFLKIIYGNIIKQFKPLWCKNLITKKIYRYDFLLKDLNIIIELDGLQHFKQISNWQEPKDRQQIDIYKMKMALKHGYSVIRILQEDVFYNKIDWKNKLIQNIQNNITPVIIYIDTNNEYEIYKKQLVL